MLVVELTLRAELPGLWMAYGSNKPKKAKLLFTSHGGNRLEEIAAIISSLPMEWVPIHLGSDAPSEDSGNSTNLR